MTDQRQMLRPAPTGALSLFSPDPDEYDNWHRVWSMPRAFNPQQRLAAAILIQAIEDVLLPYRRRWRTEAQRWIFAPSSRRPTLYPMEDACYWLGLDPSSVRRRVRSRLAIARGRTWARRTTR